MLSNVKLTKLNMLKHLGINLANASFCASKIKETRISLIMTCKQICISALAKCKPCYADNIINKNAMIAAIGTNVCKKRLLPDAIILTNPA